MKLIKKIFFKAIRIIKTFLVNIKFIILKHKLLNEHNKKIWFIATPIYSNLGDYAIVYAQYKLFDDINLRDNIVELTRYEYEVLKNKLGNIINKDDLIIIDGGGNIGTLWIEEENKMRDIVTRFKNNPIFIFPQTAFFEDTQYGKDELNKSINIYNNHKKLTIFCRDIDTYTLFKDNFSKVKSFYTPDIVMYIDDLNYEKKDNFVILNIREDKESIMDKEKSNNIKRNFINKGYNVITSSTMSSRNVNRKNRKVLLMNKLQEYSNAKLIITDRLHGMIFSAIVGTPCIALDNVSHKVKNCYKWIEYIKYIKYCDSINEFEDVILNTEELMMVGEKYNMKPNEKYFNTIKEKVLDEYNK